MQISKPFAPIDELTEQLADRKILRSHDLDRLLHVRCTDRTRIRSKSTTKPLAPITTQLHDPSRAERAAVTISHALARLKLESLPLFALLSFQVATGCRISEALRIRPYDITPSGLVILKSSKKSNDRILHGGEAQPFLKYCKSVGISPWADYTRYSVYRIYKRLGVSFQFGQNEVYSVTHAPRHLIALDIQSTANPIESTQKFLGHKSKSSTTNYTTKPIK